MAILGDQIKEYERDSVVAPQQFILWMEGEEKKHNKHQDDLNTNWTATTTWSCQLLMIYDAAEVIVLVCWNKSRENSHNQKIKKLKTESSSVSPTL
jgi:hypothetical protein